MYSGSNNDEKHRSAFESEGEEEACFFESCMLDLYSFIRIS